MKDLLEKVSKWNDREDVKLMGCQVGSYYLNKIRGGIKIIDASKLDDCQFSRMRWIKFKELVNEIDTRILNFGNPEDAFIDELVVSMPNISESEDEFYIRLESEYNRVKLEFSKKRDKLIENYKLLTK